MMPQLSCCTYRHRSSPELPSIKPIDISEDNSRGLPERSIAPVFVGAPDSPKSDEEDQKIRKIFAPLSQDASKKRSLHTLAKTTLPESNGDDNVDHRGNTSRLSQVIRQRFSRESGFSVNSSKAKPKLSVSQEEIERCRETKQTLFQEAEEKTLDDCRASQGGYDNDAEQIATLRVTKNRSGGVIKITPQHLSDVVEQSLSPIPPGHEQTLTEYHELMIPSTSSEMLRQAMDASKAPISTLAQEEYLHSMVVDADGDKDGDTNECSQYKEEKLIASGPSPAGTPLKPLPQNSTSLTHHTQSVDSIKQFKEANKATCFVKVPLSPDLLPLRMPSIVAPQEWRLSISSTSTTSKSNKVCASYMPFTSGVIPVADEPCERFCGSAELREPPESRGKTRESSDVERDLGSLQNFKNDRFHEEQKFEGIDGFSSENTLLHPGSARRELSNQTLKNTEPTNVNPVQDMSILQPSPSNSLLVSTSLSNLETLVRRELGSPTCDDSMKHVDQTKSVRQKSDSSSRHTDFTVDYFGTFMPKDNASSVYGSQPCSPFSSPSNSMMHMPNLLHKLRDFQSADLHEMSYDHALKSLTDLTDGIRRPLETFNLDIRRCRTNDNSSTPSSTPRPRARELLEADERIKQGATASTFIKDSQLREQIEDEPRGVAALGGQYVRGTGRSRTSSPRPSNEWFSSGKRNGYGYSFVPTESDDVTKIWGRALQNYVDDLKSVSHKSAGTVLHRHGRHSLRNRARHSPIRKKSAIFRARGIATSLRENAKARNHDNLATEGPNITAFSKERQWQSQSLSRRSLKSWSRFPSYSRLSRSDTPAGEADFVSTHDFVPPTAAVTRMNDITHSNLSLGKKKKSRSMTFGRSLLRSWSRLYKSRSFDFRKFERGHRSSISIGGELEYPELEILPPLSHRLPSLREQGLSTYSLGSDGAALRSITSHEGTVHSAADAAAGQNAKVWSKMYEDCIEYPRDTEEISILGNSTLKLHSELSTDLSGSQSSQKSSSKSNPNAFSLILEMQQPLQAREC